MTSSGMKRGLAATAISALAVTGLPFLAATATAAPIQGGVGDSSTAFYSPANPSGTGEASTKYDGANSTVHLLAAGGKDISKVRFEYQKFDGSWATIATVSRAHGVFSHEWSPADNLVGFSTTTIRAVGIDSLGAEFKDDAAVQDLYVDDTSTSVNIGNAAGSAIGVFQQHYGDGDGSDEALAVVHGTSSGDAGEIVELSNRSTSAAPAAAAAPSLSADMEPSGEASVVRADGDTFGTWQGTVDMTGYDWDTDATDGITDEAIIGASVFGDDDAQAVTVYNQKITTVVTSAERASVPMGGSTTVTTTVKDQNGKPIAGVQVGRTDFDGVFGVTDSNGQVTDTDVPAGSYGYYVNIDESDTDSNEAYDAKSDIKKSVTISEYVAEMKSLSTKSQLGGAIDFDEADGNFTAVLKDQNGAGYVGQSVLYQWTVTPFDGSPAHSSDVMDDVTDMDGAIYPMFWDGQEAGTYKLNAWVESGTPGQDAADMSAAALEVKAGNGKVVFNGDAKDLRDQAGANSTKVLHGKLVLDEKGNVPLAGRNVEFGWTSGDGGNSMLAPQSMQPAGVTRSEDGWAWATTGNDGSFSVAAIDPAAPKANEKGATLSVTPSDEALEGADLTVDFLTSLTPASISVVDQANLIDDMATPGRPVSLRFEVKNAEGQDIPADTLTDQMVDVSVDHGFLTETDANGDLVPASKPADGGLYGVWKNDGTSQKLTTDDNGTVGVTAAVERDAGFDDDGMLTLNVTVKAGPVTQSFPVDFTTDSPLNPGGVEIAKAAKQTVKVLPNAPTNEDAYYNVYAKDQFGNLVGDQPVDVTNAGADLYTQDSDDDGTDPDVFTDGGTLMSRFTAGPSSLIASSDMAAKQTIAGKWMADTNTWGDEDTTNTTFDAYRNDAGAKTVEGSNSVNWYVIDFAKSKYDLHAGSSTRSVGSMVHSRFDAFDQMGEPISGLHVDFFRTGPDSFRDGHRTWSDDTDQDGNAYYTWQGVKAGKAVLTTEVTMADGTPLPQAEKRETVTFGSSTSTKRVPIAAKLTAVNARATNGGAGNDIVKVNAPAKAKGAAVKLYRIRKDGSKVLVATKTANRDGNVSFLVKDSAKSKVTKFQALVTQTKVTLRDWTNRLSIR